MHTPASTSDPYVKDGPSPSLVLQLYFNELPELEAAPSRSGHLGALDLARRISGSGAAEVAQQAMLVRPFAVPDPAFKTAPGEPHCTYLVSYEGEAEDLNAWHAHYLEHHTKHMAMFPGIRELEVYTRLDWVSLHALAAAQFHAEKQSRVRQRRGVDTRRSTRRCATRCARTSRLSPSSAARIIISPWRRASCGRSDNADTVRRIVSENRAPHQRTMLYCAPASAWCDNGAPAFVCPGSAMAEPSRPAKIWYQSFVHPNRAGALHRAAAGLSRQRRRRRHRASKSTASIRPTGTFIR